jgi:acyl-CoA dehydrogenase
MAGSDLAALQTKAVSDGDDYVVNGSKIWTTGAHHANRMFCLVRTSQCERRQDGITFLLVDMDTPGLSLRPIITLGSCHEVNQLTFDDMRVPKANRVGAENSGWGVAKELMRFARASNTTSGLLRRDSMCTNRDRVNRVRSIGIESPQNNWGRGRRDVLLLAKDQGHRIAPEDF